MSAISVKLRISASLAATLIISQLHQSPRKSLPSSPGSADETFLITRGQETFTHHLQLEKARYCLPPPRAARFNNAPICSATTGLHRTRGGDKILIRPICERARVISIIDQSLPSPGRKQMCYNVSFSLFVYKHRIVRSYIAAFIKWRTAVRTWAG